MFHRGATLPLAFFSIPTPWDGEIQRLEKKIDDETGLAKGEWRMLRAIRLKQEGFRMGWRAALKAREEQGA